MSDILYDKEMDCLFCESKFTTKKIRNSKIGISKKDTDFCNYFTNEENPYYYEIWVCPNCGFAFNGGFTALKPAQKEIVRKEYIQRAGKINLCHERTPEEALRAYKLTLLCASIAGQSEITIASLCLHIAWLYRFQANAEEEKKYLAKAASSYLEAYEREDLSKNAMGENKILYLLGELNGRLGNFEETRRWFNLLFSKKNVEPAINTLARDQWVEYKASLG